MKVKIMQIGNWIPDLHNFPLFSEALSGRGKLTFGAAFCQDAVGQGDCCGAEVPLVPHLSTMRSELIFALHAEGSLSYAFEVACHFFLVAPGSFCLFFKPAAQNEFLAPRHGAAVSQFLFLHEGVVILLSCPAFTLASSFLPGGRGKRRD